MAESSGLLSSELIVEVIILIFFFFMIKESSKKIVAIVCGFLFIGLVFQTMFYVGQSSAEQYLHISGLFKYNFLSWLANILPNTKLSSLILSLDQFMSEFVVNLSNYFVSTLTNMGSTLVPGAESVSPQ